MDEQKVIERDLFDTVHSIFENRLFDIGKTEITLLMLIEFVLIIIFFFLISRLIRRFLRRQVLVHLRFAENIQFIILRLTHYVTIFLGLLIALNTLGIQLTSLVVGLGVVGVGLAFGLQNIASNFISGIILLFERHVNIGDFVTVGNNMGKVKSINIRSTTIVTLDNIMLIVPNSKFIEDTITNWSVEDPKIRINISIGVAYGSDTALVTKLLLKAASDHNAVLSNPEPEVQFKEFGDSSLNFELYAWISHPMERFRITSDLNYIIDKLFTENGITIPFPQSDVYLHQPK